MAATVTVPTRCATWIVNALLAPTSPLGEVAVSVNGPQVAGRATRGRPLNLARRRAERRAGGECRRDRPRERRRHARRGARRRRNREQAVLGHVLRRADRGHGDRADEVRDVDRERIAGAHFAAGGSRRQRERTVVRGRAACRGPLDLARRRAERRAGRKRRRNGPRQGRRDAGRRACRRRDREQAVLGHVLRRGDRRHGHRADEVRDDDRERIARSHLAARRSGGERERPVVAGVAARRGPLDLARRGAERRAGGERRARPTT